MTRTPEWVGRVWLAGVLVSVVSAVSVAVRFAEWYGSWGETGRALENSTVLTYPLVAGVAAWYASASKRRRYEWMIASADRKAREIHGRVAALVAGFAVVGCLAVGAAMAAVTASEATFGSPVGTVLLPVVAGYVASACLGVLLARRLPSMIAPVLAVVTVYAIEVFVDTGNPSLRTLAAFVVADPRERTYLAADSWILVLKAAWLLAVAWLLLEAASNAASRWLMPFGAACLLAVPLILAGDTGLKPLEAAFEVNCHDVAADTRLCMSAARDHARDEAWPALEPLTVKLHGLQGKQWVFREESISADPFPIRTGDKLTVPFGVVSGVSGNAHVVDDKMVQSDIASRLFSRCPSDSSTTSRGKPRATIQTVVHAWLLAELDIPHDETAGFEFPHLTEDTLDYTQVSDFAGWFNNLSDNQRAQWFAQHGAKLLDCTLAPPEAARP